MILGNLVSHLANS